MKTVVRFVPEAQVSDTIKRHGEDLDGRIAELQARLEKLQTIASLERKVRELETALTMDGSEVSAILAWVAQRYATNVAAMLSHERQLKCTWPRWVAIYAAREVLSLSFAALGRAFHRDHASIIYALRKMDDRISVYPATIGAELAGVVTAIRSLLRKEA